MDDRLVALQGTHHRTHAHPVDPVAIGRAGDRRDADQRAVAGIEHEPARRGQQAGIQLVP